MNIPVLQPRAAALFSAGAWAFNFACQIYGMTSTPNMKDVADKYHAFLSPQPFAIALFFAPQSALQVYWIYRLWKSSSATSSLSDAADDEQFAATEDEEAPRYAPFFILGNVCIGLWMVFWNGEHLAISDIFVNINSAAQLYYVFALLPPIAHDNKLTHVVSKMFASIGVLDVVDNFSSAFMGYEQTGFQPGIVTYVLAIAAAAGLGYVSDPIFGAGIVYCFLGLFAGQVGYGLWAFVLLLCSALSAAIIVFKHKDDKDFYLGLWKGDTSGTI